MEFTGDQLLYIFHDELSVVDWIIVADSPLTCIRKIYHFLLLCDIAGFPVELADSVSLSIDIGHGYVQAKEIAVGASPGSKGILCPLTPQVLPFTMKTTHPRDCWPDR